MWRTGADKVDELHGVLTKCGEDLKNQGLDHWDPPYPLVSLKKDAEERRVYTIRLDRKLAGTFTIGTEPLEYYDASIWSSPEAEAIYACHLAILPELQGQGIGTWCMGEIERIAAEDGLAVRLDGHEKHERLLHFYDKLGYERRGVVEDRGCPLVCFEKTPELEPITKTTDDPISLVMRFNDNINAQDADGLRALMTEDHKFIDSAGDVDYGREEMTQGWRDFFKSFPDYRNLFTLVEAKDDFVVILGRSVCKYEPLHGPAIWTAKTRDDLVAEWRVYLDTDETRRKLGIESS
jgi:GNAT superfamily N-acetyltransferase/ketosteroid isomerase-like protein